MIETILTHIAIWAPSIVSVLTILGSVILSLTKIKSALDEVKGTDDINALRKVVDEQNKLIEENSKCQKYLLEQITKIKGYADNKED